MTTGELFAIVDWPLAFVLVIKALHGRNIDRASVLPVSR